MPHRNAPEQWEILRNKASDAGRRKEWARASDLMMDALKAFPGGDAVSRDINEGPGQTLAESEIHHMRTLVNEFDRMQNMEDTEYQSEVDEAYRYRVGPYEDNP